jgi:class 3 adenylate cyclase/tRNA A-37 threonylcarbamoyl transferase component Bud32
MSPFKILIRLMRILAALLLVAIVVLLVPLGIPYLENATSYGWVRQIQEVDGRLTGVVKSFVPTKVGAYDLARLVLIVIAFALSRVVEGVAESFAKKQADRDIKRRYDAFKQGIGLSDKSRALAPIRKKMESLKPGDAKSRDELVQLMIETKKKLDSLARHVAFLAVDVVGSTDMKLGEEKAFIEHDFREYKKMVEEVMEARGALKAAWTPDGVMICFPTVDAAIGAAQDILKGLEHFNAEVKNIKTPFRVRCGINAGKVTYDKATPMEEMSDRVIDVAGHMQKYAGSDTIFIARSVLEGSSATEGFKSAGQEVDGYEVFHWKAATADPTVMPRKDPTRMRLQTPGAEGTGLATSVGTSLGTTLTPLSELSNPHAAATRPRMPAAQEMTVKVERPQHFDPSAPGNSSVGSTMSGLTKLGKYEIRRVLGKGAMGVVYEGWDPTIERRVAIKTIRPDQLESTEAEEILTRFKREAKAAGRLSHPNIVAVFEFGQDGPVNFIAMEFIEGRELKEYFDKGERFSLADTVRLMTQLLDALDLAGRNGVVHRDIKPSNIIILPDGRVKVADFGIARVESSALTQTGAALGTPSYMSPEQLMGQPVDGRSDLFSAGVVLYQFLTGEKPFTGERTTTIITKILSEQPSDPSSLNVTVPKAFDAAVRKALAKRPDDRFQTGREFAEALKQAMENRERPKELNAAGDDDATLVAQP